jgi:hypothetical protein
VAKLAVLRGLPIIVTRRAVIQPYGGEIALKMYCVAMRWFWGEKRGVVW